MNEKLREMLRVTQIYLLYFELMVTQCKLQRMWSRRCRCSLRWMHKRMVSTGMDWRRERKWVRSQQRIDQFLLGYDHDQPFCRWPEVLRKWTPSTTSVQATTQLVSLPHAPSVVWHWSLLVVIITLLHGCWVNPHKQGHVMQERAKQMATGRRHVATKIS